MDARKIAENNLFFYTLAGSHAYGMDTEYSDKDYRGLFYVPKNVYMSLFKHVEQVEKFGDQKDSVVFEISKYIKLLVEQNPNILELLWVEPRFIVQTSSLYETLRSVREDFLSSKAKHTFSGYAMSQLKRIKGHNKWITNPQPKRRPKEIDFVSVIWNNTGSKEHNNKPFIAETKAYELGGDIFILKHEPSNAQWIDRHEALITYPLSECQKNPKIFMQMVKFNRQLYKDHVENWKNYWEWKNNRNEARSALEEKHGYDTKHAAHLVRLFRMGIEILKGEGVKVYRPDAQELLDIRNGKLTYDQLISYSQELDAEMEALYKTTKLPHHIDEDWADKVAQKIYEMAWSYDLNAPDFKANDGIGYKNVRA